MTGPEFRRIPLCPHTVGGRSGVSSEHDSETQKASLWRLLNQGTAGHWWLMTVILSYSGGRDQKDHPAWANSSVRPYLEKNPSQKRVGGVTRGVGPEFKPQKKKNSVNKLGP
jgi:hypothetical protein